MKKKIFKNHGIVFWITGLSGSGKSTIGQSIKKEIQKKFGPTIIINGDDIRRIFKLKSYEKASRLNIAQQYSKFCQFISKKNINIIFTAVALFHQIHKINRAKIKNYLEIYIESDIKIIKRKKNKIFYKTKSSNVWGIDIKPEFPKKPDVKIVNNFNKTLKEIKKELLKKIFKKLS